MDEKHAEPESYLLNIDGIPDPPAVGQESTVPRIPAALQAILDDVFRTALAGSGDAAPLISPPIYLHSIGIDGTTAGALIANSRFAQTMPHHCGPTDWICLACGLWQHEIDASPIPLPCLGRPVR